MLEMVDTLKLENHWKMFSIKLLNLSSSTLLAH